MLSYILQLKRGPSVNSILCILFLLTVVFLLVFVGPSVGFDVAPVVAYALDDFER